MSEAPFVASTVRKRTFDLIASYRGVPMQGPFSDWPSYVQDVVYAALAEIEAKVKLPLELERAGSDRDYDVDGVCFIHVVAVGYETTILQ